jgi:hypothetical protein
MKIFDDLTKGEKRAVYKNCRIYILYSVVHTGRHLVCVQKYLFILYNNIIYIIYLFYLCVYTWCVVTCVPYL